MSTSTSRIGSTASTPSEPLGFNMGAIVLAAALIGLSLAYAIDAAGRRAEALSLRLGESGSIQRSIGGHTLTIPNAWFRFDEQSSEGFAREVQLRLHLQLGQGGPPTAVDVTLLPKSQVRASARLLDGVYLHLFQPEQLSGPPGLIGKPLRNMDGYSGETVWYDAISADPFVAKCLAPVTGGAAQRCIRTVHLTTGIAAVFAFDVGALNHWRAFDPAMAAKLAFIGAQ